MPDLTVWRYSTPLGVDAGEVRLKRLEESGVLTVHDAAAVIWMPGAEKPRIRRLRHHTTRAAAEGSIWGGLVGLVLMGPVAGAAVGATLGAVGQRLRVAGIDDDVIAEIRRELVPGTSALFVLSGDVDVKRLRPLLARREAVLVHARLSPEAPEDLRDLLQPP